jgi:hypothetical protein
VGTGEEQRTLRYESERRIKDPSLWKREKNKGHFDMNTRKEQRTFGCGNGGRTKDTSM